MSTRRKPPARRPFVPTLPQRAAIVLWYVRQAVPPGVPTRYSNADAQRDAKIRSAGEVSAIMRWLAGEPMPDSPHHYLRAPAPRAYITRTWTGYGYEITLHAEPEATP
jgi:hypothetical protein